MAGIFRRTRSNRPRRSRHGILPSQPESLEIRTLLAADLGFTPLAGSVAVGSLPETAPFALAPEWSQSVLESQSTLQPGESMPVGNDANAWNDMLTVNENGPEAGRYLFRAHELFSFLGGNAGISRTDLVTGETVTISQRADYDAMDPAFWSPWGTLITGEESAGAGTIPDPDVTGSLNGLVYEITNPLADPEDVQTIARPALGSMAHEGIQFDGAGNVYLVDEFNGGSIYKFVPQSWGDLSTGQLFVLKVTTPVGADPSVGSGIWTPLNDADGNPLPGITDPRTNARAAANDAAGTDYLRPEDMQMSRLANGNEVLYVATTTDNRVLSIELAAAGPVVREFVTRSTPVDSAAGSAVGTRLTSPDNLAVDARGQVFVVEDQSPGDIWGTVDANNDGVAEYLGLFASLSTAGAEPTGLYFNPFNPNEAWVNVQHSASDNDATIVLRRTEAESGAKVVNGVLSVYGTSGSDSIEVSGMGHRLSVEINGENAGVFRSTPIAMIRIDGDAGDDHISLPVAATRRSLLFGGDGNDIIYGTPGADIISGGTGDDTLFGGAGDDSIDGNEGHDLLFGERGADRLSGGDGHDSLFGGDDTDWLAGGSGNDRIFGDAGSDYLSGGDGDDQLSGGSGADALVGEAGNDRLDGGSDADLLLGGDGNDDLFGGSGADALFGDAGDDRLRGEGGADLLDGGLGFDWLFGGEGFDLLLNGERNRQ